MSSQSTRAVLWSPANTPSKIFFLEKNFAVSSLMISLFAIYSIVWADGLISQKTLLWLLFLA